MRKLSSETSLYLDLIRAAASQFVCIGHAISFFGVLSWMGPPNFFYIQNFGVVVFFILSGFIITHTILTNRARPEYTFGQYVLDRLTRIYVPFLPSLVFVGVIDFILIRHYSMRSPETFTLQHLIGSGLMLQALPASFARYFPNGIAWGNFGSAGHFWTVAIEFHLYLFVGAFLLRKKFSPQSLSLVPILLTAAVPYTYLWSSVQPHLGTGLFSAWIMGGLSAWIVFYKNPNFRRFALLGGAIVSSALYLTVLNFENSYASYNMMSYPFLAITFLCVVLGSVKSQFLSAQRPLATGIRFFASYSYSLYLVHHSVLLLVSSLFPHSGGAGAIGAILIANCVGYLFWFLFERHYKSVRSYLRRTFLAVGSGKTA